MDEESATVQVDCGERYPETLANALLGGGIAITNVTYNGDNVGSGWPIIGKN
jgi:hypothetical protein